MTKNESLFLNLKFKFWQCFLIQKLIETKSVTFTFDKSIKWTFNHERIIQNETKQWFATIDFTIIDNYIVYKKLDAQAIQIFDELKFYFDNTNYQKNDCFQICQRLKILNVTTFRIEKMIVNRQLYYWQFFAMKWILKMMKHSHFQNCIFVDYMKIEKTFETLIFVMTINNFHLFVCKCLSICLCYSYNEIFSQFVCIRIIFFLCFCEKFSQ